MPTRSAAPSATSEPGVTARAVPTPLGQVLLTEARGALVGLRWSRAPAADRTALLLEAERQIGAYFRRDLRSFDLPLGPPSDPFAAWVRAALLAIPFGATSSYGALARLLQSSPRAIGQAMGANRLPIFVPCHRVLAANGLGGYSGGAGAVTKRRLLAHEGAILL